MTLVLLIEDDDENARAVVHAFPSVRFEVAASLGAARMKLGRAFAGYVVSASRLDRGGGGFVREIRAWDPVSPIVLLVADPLSRDTTVTDYDDPDRPFVARRCAPLDLAPFIAACSARGRARAVPLLSAAGDHGAPCLAPGVRDRPPARVAARRVSGVVEVVRERRHGLAEIDPHPLVLALPSASALNVLPPEARASARHETERGRTEDVLYRDRGISCVIIADSSAGQQHLAWARSCLRNIPALVMAPVRWSSADVLERQGVTFVSDTTVRAHAKRVDYLHVQARRARDCWTAVDTFAREAGLAPAEGELLFRFAMGVRARHLPRALGIDPNTKDARVSAIRQTVRARFGLDDLEDMVRLALGCWR